MSDSTNQRTAFRRLLVTGHIPTSKTLPNPISLAHPAAYFKGLYLKRSGEMCPVTPRSAPERFRYNPLPYLAFALDIPRWERILPRLVVVKDSRLTLEGVARRELLADTI